MKPDFDCLKNFCKSKYPDSKILSYLLDDCHIMPNDECLKNIIRYGREKDIKMIYQKIYGYHEDDYDDYEYNYENNEYLHYEKYLRSKYRQSKKYSYDDSEQE